MKRPKPIPVEQLSTIHMVAGGEKTISKVIDDGIVKQWVGIGWVSERPAEAADYNRYPRVKRDASH